MKHISSGIPPKKRTQQHWIFIYCFFFFFLLESRGTRHERIRSCCQLSGDWFFCAASELDKLNYTNNPKLSSDDRASACERFVYSCFLCLHPSELLRRRRRTLNSDVHETQAIRKWSVKVLAHTLDEIFWKAAVEKVKRSQKALYLNQEESMRAESYLIECFFHIYNTLQTKQNKTKKKSKLCFLLGRLWSLLSPVCEDRTATLAG